VSQAISEPNFSVAYAHMCKYMSEYKVPVTDKPGEMVSFRKLLLNRCQREFEKDKAEELDLERLQKEIDEAQGVRVNTSHWTTKQQCR
jgi:translation initiation factor 4G